jgi:allantoin racemase
MFVPRHNANLPMKILAINPNTTESMTQTLLEALRAQSGGTLSFEGATASRGVAVVASRASYAIAAVSVLEVWAGFRGAVDGILVGCFGDPGVLALRELTDVPVFGLAEAAMEIASKRYDRFAVVTAGQCWVPMIDELATLSQIDGYLGTTAIDTTGLSAQSDPSAFHSKMQAAIGQAERSGAEAILLGGAALVGSANSYDCAVPLLDCVDLAVLKLKLGIPPRAKELSPPSVSSVGIDADLADLLSRPQSR